MATTVPTIERALTQIAPRSTNGIARRTTAYMQQIQTLNAKITAYLHSIPTSQQTLITSHNAFDYFATHYGIRVINTMIPSQTKKTQPSTNQLSRLAQLVHHFHIRAIFPKSSLNPKLTKTMATQTGTQTDLELYNNTLKPKNSAGDTYLKIKLTNAQTMVENFTKKTRTCRISHL